MTRQFDIREPSIEALKQAPVYFRYGANKRRILVDALTADAILTVYGALNPDNQAKFERLVSGSPEHLQRAASFAFKHARVA